MATVLLLLLVWLPSLASLAVSAEAAWLRVERGGRLGPTMQVGSKRVNRRKRGAQVAERRLALDRVRLERPGSVLQSRGASQKPTVVPPFRFLCVLDVEATCEKNCRNYVHEIIEFPVVVVDLYEKEIVGEFHSYVRPTVNSTLSDFCTKLTGITQEKVDQSPTLDQVRRGALVHMLSDRPRTANKPSGARVV